MTAELTANLKELRLPAIRACHREHAERALAQEWTHEQYLLELTRTEMAERMEHRVERLLAESRLAPGKTMESFDNKRLPRKAAGQIKVLLDGGFLDRAENVLVFGNPGSGKTHLLSALGHEIVRQGRRVLFTSCCLLVQDLLRAKQELRLERQLKRLRKYEALIIDDIGYVQHGREEMEVLFTLLADRYERASILLTSNLPFSKWETIFKDPMTTAAAIDRLVHHSIILELNVKSYRMEEAGRSKTQDEP